MTREINHDDELSDPVIKTDRSHRAEYLKLLEIHNQNRIDYNVRKWETIKFGQVLTSVSLFASITSYFAAVQWKLFGQDSAIKYMIALLAVLGSGSSVLTLSNLRRESARLFEEEGMMFKLAKLLDLDINIPERHRWIPTDQNLLFEKWLDYKVKIDPHAPIGSFWDWVEARTKDHLFYLGYGMLFSIFALIGLGIAAYTILTK